MNRRLAVVVTVCLAAAGILLRWYMARPRPTKPKRIESKVPSKSSGRNKSKRTPSPEIEDPTIAKFIMLLGIPGSGKSTWAKEFVFRCDASYTIVSSDAVRQQITGNLNDQSKNSEVWDVVLNHCQGLLSNGKNVILDATNTSTDKRRWFVKQLPRCQRYLKTFSIQKSIAKSRIARDLEKGVGRAQVPDAVIDTMYRQFQDSLLAIRDEGWLMK
jgi:predicted kinase